MSKHQENLDNEDYQDLLNKFEGLRKGLPNSYFEEEEFERLIDHLDDREKYTKALEIATHATEQYPFSSVLLVQKANLLIILNRFNQALSALDQAELVETPDSTLYVLRVESLLGLGRENEAEKVFQHSLTLFERDEKLDLLFEMADLFDEFEEFEKVFDCLSDILKIDPENEEALYKICFWTDLTGRNEESIRLHQQIIDDHPFNEIAWFNLGAAYQGLRLHEKAIDAYKYAIAINEKFEYAYRNLGDAYLRLRKYKEAAEVLETVIDLGEPEMVVYEAIGHCYDKMHRFAKAREFYRKGLGLNPEDSQLYYKVALSYMSQDEWTKAIKSLETAIRLQTGQADYNIAIGQCYMELHQYEKAIQYFSEVVTTRPKNINGWTQFLRCVYEAGLYDEGLNYTGIALSHTAGKPAFLYFKSLFLLGQGKLKEAIVVLEKAMAANSKLIKKFVQLEPMLLQYPQVIMLISRYKKKKPL